MPISAYIVLVQEKANDKLREIGVSNYTAQQLRELAAGLRQIDKECTLPLPFQETLLFVCQNHEFHPFFANYGPSSLQRAWYPL